MKRKHKTLSDKGHREELKCKHQRLASKGRDDIIGASVTSEGPTSGGSPLTVGTNG